MICTESIYDEPEFWTILKTPYKQKEYGDSYLAHTMSCDGASSIYSINCQYPATTASNAPSVLVTDGATQLSPNDFSLYIIGTALNIYFNEPPSASTVIKIYFHE